MGAIIVVDAFWGDSGKGKMAAYLADKYRAAFSARAGTGTNAGHSIFFADGRQIRTHQLPCGFLHRDTQIRIGSGVAVDPECFFSELDALDPTYSLRERTRIDYRCPIIEAEHRLQERENVFLNETVGTTASGTGAALAAFTMRQARQVRDMPALADYATDVAHELNQACMRGETVVIEGSQGTHLSLALSDDYPHCTSDNCTTAAFADDVGLNWQHISEVVLVVKALPSRVGSGPLPLQLDSEEEDRRNIAEYGVRTGRRRRKAAGLSWSHLQTAIELNGPTQLALTFCDHIDPLASQARSFADLPASVRRLVDELEERLELPVALCDCGKNFENILERS